ncbi:site-specific integrase [Burkholderia cenocepacia]
MSIKSYKGKNGLNISYRVQIKNKAVQVDKVFQSLEEANDYSIYVRSKEYQEQEREKQKLQDTLQQKVAEQLNNPPLRNVLIAFSKTRTHLASYNTDRTKLLGSIPATTIPLNSEQVLFTQRSLGIVFDTNKNDKIEFGSLKLSQINTDIIELYIKERKAQNIARATIIKELGLLAQCFDTVPITYKSLAEQYRVNPARLSTSQRKTLLPTVVLPEPIRITNDNEALILEKLKKFRNKAMLDIVMLLFSTGMRRSEALFLTWKQIDFDNKFINLINTQTKAKKSRVIPINDIAFDCLSRTLERYKQEFLEQNPNSEFKIEQNKRLFTYTVDGFKKNIQRLQDWVKIDGFKLHILRHEFISRLNESQNINIHQLSKLTGITDTEYLQSKIVEPLNRKKSALALANGTATTEDIMRVVGHEDTKINARYTHIDNNTLIEALQTKSNELSREELLEEIKRIGELQQKLMEQALKKS